MIAVSDSSPLHYLILIGEADLLRRFFDGILIPQSVYQELQCRQTPNDVREWIEKPPPWAVVRTAAAVDATLPLGKGEREAIALALESPAKVILLDDKKARRIAQQHSLAVVGTLAILQTAHNRGWAQLPKAIGNLRECGFRISGKLVEQLCRDVFPSP